MKKIATIALILIISLCIFGTTRVFAESNSTSIIDAENESQLIKIKENATKSLEDYKEKYGSDAYGIAAYVLNIIRIYSIPFCFLGIAISAIYQYVIGIRKLDTQEKGLVTMISFYNYFSNMPNFTISLCDCCKIWKGVTNESFICSK